MKLALVAGGGPTRESRSLLERNASSLIIYLCEQHRERDAELPVLGWGEERLGFQGVGWLAGWMAGWLVFNLRYIFRMSTRPRRAHL